jgi:predicted metalloprotease
MFFYFLYQIKIQDMLWQGRRESGNVSDRRFSGGGMVAGGGIVGAIIYILFQFLGGGGEGGQNIQLNGGRQLSATEQRVDDERAHFVKVVLAETENVWNKIFSEKKLKYREPTLVLYRDYQESACGTGSTAMGPFYCPADEQVYIDLSFYNELQNRFKAPGDFAMAYVIAHEVGHHVQKLLGISEKMERLRGHISQTEYNKSFSEAGIAG